MEEIRSCHPTGTCMRYCSPKTNIRVNISSSLVVPHLLTELNWSETFVPQSATPTPWGDFPVYRTARSGLRCRGFSAMSLILWLEHIAARRVRIGHMIVHKRPRIRHQRWSGTSDHHTTPVLQRSAPVPTSHDPDTDTTRGNENPHAYSCMDDNFTFARRAYAKIQLAHCNRTFHVGNELNLRVEKKYLSVAFLNRRVKSAPRFLADPQLDENVRTLPLPSQVTRFLEAV